MAKKRRRNVDWQAGIAAAKAEFPDLDLPDEPEVWATYWGEQLAGDETFELMGKPIRDLLRVGNTPVRRGSRPDLSTAEYEARYRDLFEAEYTNQRFPEALKSLIASTEGVRDVARRSGLQHSRVWRLSTGEVTPQLHDIQQIAEAFHKPLTYFVEYRVALVCGTFASYLEQNHEVAVRLARALEAERAP